MYKYNVLKTSIITTTTGIIHQPTNCISDSESPKCWDRKQIKYFCEEYPWIYFKNKKLGCKLCVKVNLNIEKKPESHIRLSSEWTQCNIVPSGDTIAKRQASLRKKISKHKSSQPHITAESIIARSKQETFKLQRPYVDMPKLVDLQVLNGTSMGRILQSDKSCATIIDHIANEMRIKICKDIIENNRKLCIIVDEATTLSKKTMLVIYLRIELNCTTAESIKNTILCNLSKYNIDLEFLKNNLVGFVSDGAFTMLGRKAGVGALLLKHFRDLIVWHCCNHRLELAEMSFKGVKLSSHKSVQRINSSQSFRSLLNNLKSRLFTTQSSNSSNNVSSKFQEEYDQLLSDLDIFVPKNWPDNFNIQYGDDCIRRLSKKFKIDAITSVRDFRQFKDTKEDNVEDLKLLTTAI
ncbi:hypothetical protein QTP88_004202 [Uroleucon formosanum]